jgi:molecular chaperone IbpA
MLHIDLLREVPEALKPRQIPIQSQPPVTSDVVDAKAVN